jgi:hypothetical protein
MEPCLVAAQSGNQAAGLLDSTSLAYCPIAPSLNQYGTGRGPPNGGPMTGGGR